MGCDMIVEKKDNDIQVTGHQCNAGIAYAKKELTNPTRNIATSVRVTGGDMPMLSVKTAKPIPKTAIKAVVDAIHQVTHKAPVKVGDIVLSNAADTGVDIIATRNIAALCTTAG